MARGPRDDHLPDGDKEYWDGYTKEEAEKVLSSLEMVSVPPGGELARGPNCPFCGEFMKFHRYAQIFGGYWTCSCPKMNKRETKIGLFFWVFLGGLILWVSWYVG